MKNSKTLFQDFVKQITLKESSEEVSGIAHLVFENLLATILVLVILLLFFSPQLLMGWINKSNFVF